MSIQDHTELKWKITSILRWYRSFALEQLNLKRGEIFWRVVKSLLSQHHQTGGSKRLFSLPADRKGHFQWKSFISILRNCFGAVETEEICTFFAADSKYIWQHFNTFSWLGSKLCFAQNPFCKIGHQWTLSCLEELNLVHFTLIFAKQNSSHHTSHS